MSSALLRALADRIDLNKDYQFGGAFILIPPGGMEPIEGLIIGQPDLAMFWSMVKGKIDVALAELQNAEEVRRQAQGFGRR